jgi:hypothetical protein
MDLNDISRILIKVAGISIMVFVLVGIPTYISYYFSLRLADFSFMAFFFMSILPMLIPLSAGYLMWKFPGTIANKIVSSEKEKATTNSKTIEDIEIIAFSVLGLYLLFNATSDIAYNLSYFYQTKEAAGEGSLLIEPYSFIIATIVEIIFALILLFGSKTLVRMFRKLRYGGIEK